MATLSALPERFNAGTTVEYTVSYADFPANAGWTLKLYVAGITVTATTNGASFVIALTAAATSAVADGRYSWAEVVTETATGKIYTAAEGFVVIDPNPITATAAQSRDPKEALLDSFEAARDALVTGRLAAYQIGSRSFTYHDLSVITREIARLKREIRASQFPGQLGPMVQAHFTRPA